MNDQFDSYVRFQKLIDRTVRIEGFSLTAERVSVTSVVRGVGCAWKNDRPAGGSLMIDPVKLMGRTVETVQLVHFAEVPVAGRALLQGVRDEIAPVTLKWEE